ncbi:hypothetical protein H4R35_006003 [Dimargaris xerosporica]|nr:hypothetical protein H4R35_006003 [Dimargaris xerosporica]
MSEQRFPVAVRQAQGLVGDCPTDVLALGFSNQIVVHVTQLPSIGVLSQITLEQPTQPSALNTMADEHPSIPLQTQYLLGSPSNATLNTIYDLFATHIMTAVQQTTPTETRPLLLGLSFKDHTHWAQSDTVDRARLQQTLSQVAQLVKSCQVW